MELKKNDVPVLKRCDITKKIRGVYLVSCSLAIVYWFISIFLNGKNSKQLKMFYLDFQDFLADFLNVVGYSAYGDPYNCTAYTGRSEKGYPPLCYVLTRPFAEFVDIDAYYQDNCFLQMYHEPLLLIMYSIVTTLILVMLYVLIKDYIKGNSLVKHTTSAVFLLSAPVLFTLERGNLILLAAVSVMIFVFYYDNENRVKREIALISIGLAFGLKLSPALFGCLLLFRKQYFEAVRAAIYGLLFFFVPFLFLKGGFSNISLMLENIKMLSAYYGNESGCTLWNCFHSILPLPVADFCGGSFRYIFVLWLGGSAFFCKRKWERAAILALMILFVPFPSHYYGLLYLIPAVVLFLNEERYRKADWIVMLCFLNMFVLLNYQEIPLLSELNISYSSSLMLLTIILLYYGTVPMITTTIEFAVKKEKRESLNYNCFYKLLKTQVSPENSECISVEKSVRKYICIIAFLMFYLFILSFNKLYFVCGIVLLILLYFIAVLLLKHIIFKMAENKKRPELLQSQFYYVLDALPSVSLTPKKNKNSRLRLGFLITILAASIAGTVIVKTHPNIPKEIGYKTAIHWYEKGRYEKAADVFDSLGDYKESEYYLEKCLSLQGE